MNQNERPGSAPDTLHALHGQFIRVVELYGEMERTPRRFGTDTLMTNTQIHLIEVIGDFNESLGVTELAARKGVTKGAVSQNVKKLKERDLVYQEADPDNQSRTIIKLTDKGRDAYRAHREWHDTADGGFRRFMEEAGEEKRMFLYDTLVKVANFLEKLRES